MARKDSQTSDPRRETDSRRRGASSQHCAWTNTQFARKGLLRQCVQQGVSRYLTQTPGTTTLRKMCGEAIPRRNRQLTPGSLAAWARYLKVPIASVILRPDPVGRAVLILRSLR